MINEHDIEDLARFPQPGGMKYDQEKPRMDLLDPEFLEGVADVLTFGANKYSQRGACDCLVAHVAEILKYGPKDFANLVTTPALSESTKTLITSVNGNIDEKIKSVYESIKSNTSWITPESLRKSVETLLNDSTESRTQSWMHSLLKRLAQYVVLNPKLFASTITMSLDEYENVYVRDVTLLWDSLKELSGQIKHSPTCKSTQVIKTGAHNWRTGIHVSRLIAASYRHLGAINRGEDIDPESGKPHVYHLGCCVQFLSWMLKHRPDLDDRWKGQQ